MGNRKIEVLNKLDYFLLSLGTVIQNKIKLEEYNNNNKWGFKDLMIPFPKRLHFELMLHIILYMWVLNMNNNKTNQNWSLLSSY